MRSIPAEVTAPENNQLLSQPYTVITDLAGIVLSVNDVLFRALQMPRADLFDRPLVSIFSEKDFTVPAAGFAALFCERAFFQCSTVLNTNGNSLFVHWTVARMHTRSSEEAVLQWTGLEANTKKRHLVSAGDVYKSLFDDSPQPMWIYNKATLQFLDVNEAAISHYGYSKDEFLQMTLADIRPEQERKKFHGHMYSLKPTKLADKTIWLHQRKDGAMVHVEVQSYNFLYEGIQARLVMINDVTQKEKIRKTLLESEARFRNMADNLR